MKAVALLGSVVACWLASGMPASAQSTGDANCNGTVDAADLVAVEDVLFERTLCLAADVNNDDVISAADLSADVPLAVLAGTPTATATAGTPTSIATPTPVVATPTPTATAAPTATLVTCPAAGADLLLTIDNQTGDSPPTVTVSGRRAGAACINSLGLDETYSVSISAGSQSVSNIAAATASGSSTRAVRLRPPSWKGSLQRAMRWTVRRSLTLRKPISVAASSAAEGTTPSRRTICRPALPISATARGCWYSRKTGSGSTVVTIPSVQTARSLPTI